MRTIEFVKRHSLVIGIVLMFALTWPFYSALGLFVGYGLAVAALIMTGLTLGRAGVRALLRRFLIWRVGVQYGGRVPADRGVRNWQRCTWHDRHRYRVCGRIRHCGGGWASAAVARIADSSSGLTRVTQPPEVAKEAKNERTSLRWP